LEKKAAEQEAMEKAKTAQRAAGKLTGLSGRALFEVGGDLYDDDDEGEEDWDISRMLATYVSYHHANIESCELTNSEKKTRDARKKRTMLLTTLRMALMSFLLMARKMLMRLYQLVMVKGMGIIL
jgi:hypothetical protein